MKPGKEPSPNEGTSAMKQNGRSNNILFASYKEESNFKLGTMVAQPSMPQLDSSDSDSSLDNSSPTSKENAMKLKGKGTPSNLDHRREATSEMFRRNHYDFRTHVHQFFQPELYKYIFWYLVFAVVASGVMVCMILWLTAYRAERYRSRDFAGATAELDKRVYGQKDAMSILKDSLLLDEPRMKVIVLSGGSGVGKSYTADIIKAHFPKHKWITKLFPPIHEEGANFNFYPDLIIIENLRPHDLHVLTDFLKRLRKSIPDKRYITVIAVINDEINETSDAGRTVSPRADFNKTLENANITVNVIPYKSLNATALDKCIDDVIRHNGLTPSEEQIDFVIKYQLKRNIGCKGIYAKLQQVSKYWERDSAKFKMSLNYIN